MITDIRNLELYCVDLPLFLAFFAFLGWVVYRYTGLGKHIRDWLEYRYYRSQKPSSDSPSPEELPGWYYNPEPRPTPKPFEYHRPNFSDSSDDQRRYSSTDNGYLKHVYTEYLLNELTEHGFFGDGDDDNLLPPL
ncbi:MAG: hypothetical protein HPY64_08180 [Anaerolineae bacterium]|nr:hypothetical protein [Anaerolineae bacterium]